jgi:phosphopantothenoylcysteine synthetase/decarboxylase
MHILVTAGHTLVPIDRVRCLTNVFSGRTGSWIALQAHQRGHAVTLLTSHPKIVTELCRGTAAPAQRWALHPYHTFDELRDALEEKVRPGAVDAIVHSAAVSDYLSAGVYAPRPGTRFREEDGQWESSDAAPALEDRAAGKVKSDEPELWLRLVRAPRLIDLFRPVWKFPGILVKFKLEVGVSEEQLLDIAERSRRHSDADLMVANTLEGAMYHAFLGPLGGRYQRIGRKDLAARLLEAVEQLHQERVLILPAGLNTVSGEAAPNPASIGKPPLEVRGPKHKVDH